MRIATLELENWTRFAGQHTLHLDASVYAVVCRWHHDDERSNFGGKSKAVGAVPFALYGCKPSDIRLEDDWITHGKPYGHVQLTLDDGMVIKRSRKRGKSTQLHVEHDGRKLTGKEAQAFIVERVGLTEQDFFASCCFEQRQMARFILAQPADRHKTVSEWFALALLQQCEDIIRAKLTALGADDHQLKRKSEMAFARAESALEGLADGGAAVAPQVMLATREREAKRLQSEATKLQGSIDDHADWMIQAQNAAEYERLRKQGYDLKERRDGYTVRPEHLSTKHEAVVAAEAELQQAQTETSEARKLCRGEFDGQCPIITEPCPVAAKIREKAGLNIGRLTRAEAAEQSHRENCRQLRGDYSETSRELDQAKRTASEFRSIRDRALVLQSDHDAIERTGQPPDTSELQEQVAAAWDRANEAQLAYQRTKDAIELCDAQREAMNEIEAEREELAERLALHRRALGIFGRNGAQRKIAERNLSEIQHGANALLREAGIDLSVEVLWSRDAASGLANHCDICGAAFPKSQRVKKCECGAIRGPKTVERLDVELSDRSGAAEDMAGISLQLSAAAWLRRKRCASWSVALIDEPFSQLDGTHRQTMAVHLQQMLCGRWGFEQSAIISHDTNVREIFPDRIEIVADAEGSRFAS